MAEKKYTQMLQEIDTLMDERFGKVGTPEREAFRKEAYAYCVGQIISEARKRKKVRLACASRFRNLQKW